MSIKTVALKLISKFIAPRAVPVLNSKGQEPSARELAFTGRGKSGKVSHKRGNAAQLKRMSLKRNNIRKHS
jgi:hypothetical protein